MTKVPMLTVIVPTYNRRTLLGYTLESLARQALPRERFEVLVVDDGSSDDTASLIPAFQDRLDLRYFYQPDEGFQVAKARNIGIAAAKGQICVFADGGIMLHSGCLAAHLKSHLEASEPLAVCGYVYGWAFTSEDAVRLNESIDPGDPDVSIARIQASGHWTDVREDFYARYGDDFTSLPAPWIVYWTGNASAQTGLLRSIGMFDENFRSWGTEDVDVGYRLYRAGARMVVNRAATSVHYGHETNLEENIEIAVKNCQYFSRKYGTPITELMGVVPTIPFFELNDVIAERGLPRCEDYLAERKVAS